MSRSERRWFLGTLALSCVTILAIIFSLWELVEHRYFRHLDYMTLHYLYITRGIASSLLIGLWATWFVLRQRRRHEGELERSRERYRSILNSSPQAVVLFDESFRVAEWNSAAEQLYGRPRELVLGEVLPTIPAERWSELKEILGRLERGEAVFDYETERSTAKGDCLPVAVSYSRLPQIANQPKLFLEVAQDIRPRLQLRDKFLEVEKLTLMGQMAAGTAHHLNTPLTAMLLQVQMLQQQAAAAERSELELIERRIRFCQTFVQNLLQFGRRSQPQQKPLSLSEIIEAVATMLRPSLAAKRAQLRVEVDGLRPCRILGDPNHLEVMFAALLSNGIDAISTGGSIHIHGCPTPNGQTEVHIDDNGPGIPTHFLSRVFEPFFTTKPAGQGTGLGLAIARSVVQEHGGTLHLQNREGGGLRATVRLPLMDQSQCSPERSRESRR